MTRYKYVNGEKLPYTAEEEAARDAAEAAAEVATTFAAEVSKADNAYKEANDALKSSAKAKLIAGEALTEDEANTIVI